MLSKKPNRVLRDKGVLMFTMPLPATVGSPWYTHLQPEFIRKVAHHFPSTEQYMDLFASTGFTCVAGVNLLSKAMPPLLKNHFDHDGPFKLEWRIATCVFNNVKGELLENILADLKQKAPLKEFMETHDRTSDLGQITLFVCISN